MRSEHTIPFDAVLLPGSNSSATTPEIAAGLAARDSDPDANERWRAWRARGTKHDRETTQVINRSFVVMILALSGWLLLQLLG
jgi:hypothetical protein